ncbi:type II secretion system F family protein [Nonomuraea aurantiaca]|uniref:type II secretion system F family protein n=1 Tax=Nonomuraea aurantiaca TaxID=2878562 RepID=UPI001CDA3D35|nr:type II secretion system F family protein [Nonomuraea aurantiaca]MCA2229797.1 type II secretion system F family protein [Nonomuraea aurantiaca]
MATWLWISPTTPAERLTRLLSPGAATHLRPGAAKPPHPPRTHRLPNSGSTDPDADTFAPPTWLDHPATSPRRINRRTLAGALGAALITALLVGGGAGLIAALLVAPIVGVVLHRQDDPETRQDSKQITTDLPFAADLMAACLLAGQPVSAATEMAAGALAGPLGQRLSWVSRQLRLGADPDPTWAFLAQEPATAQLSRAMSRAAQTGAPVADVLTRLADDARQSTRATSVAAAKSVGVKAVAPLGLCFLPAFVLLGIIPVVAGLATAISVP